MRLRIANEGETAPSYGQPRFREFGWLMAVPGREQGGERRMVKSAIVAALLMLGLLAGVCIEPDSGTAASVGPPDMFGLSVCAQHAKPLPRLPTPADILLLSAPALILAILALHPVVSARAIPVERIDPPPRRFVLGRVHARRGPPAFA
jgi:hypothetical protein